jgi:hypothetical protein
MVSAHKRMDSKSPLPLTQIKPRPSDGASGRGNSEGSDGLCDADWMLSARFGDAEELVGWVSSGAGLLDDCSGNASPGARAEVAGLDDSSGARKEMNALTKPDELNFGKQIGSQEADAEDLTMDGECTVFNRMCRSERQCHRESLSKRAYTHRKDV